MGGTLKGAVGRIRMSSLQCYEKLVAERKENKKK